MPYICSYIAPLGPVAIGGNINLVLKAGIRHIAMITALTEAADIERATRGFMSLI